jgi:hypothetical protein
MRKSTFFIGFVIVASACAFLLLFFYPRLDRPGYREAREETRRMIREYELTDLSLFTEASYTRHPTQTDLHTPFQDHPMAFEHFPSGSFIAPPPHLKAVKP